MSIAFHAGSLDVRADEPKVHLSNARAGLVLAELGIEPGELMGVGPSELFLDPVARDDLSPVNYLVHIDLARLARWSKEHAHGKVCWA